MCMRLGGPPYSQSRVRADVVYGDRFPAIMSIFLISFKFDVTDLECQMFEEMSCSVCLFRLSS